MRQVNGIHQKMKRNVKRKMNDSLSMFLCQVATVHVHDQSPSFFLCICVYMHAGRRRRPQFLQGPQVCVLGSWVQHEGRDGVTGP